MVRYTFNKLQHLNCPSYANHQIGIQRNYTPQFAVFKQTKCTLVYTRVDHVQNHK